MKEILLSPLYSLFSLNFYRRVLRSPLSKGFSYLLYLSVLFAFGVTIVFMFTVIPIGNEFANWLKQNFPELVLTREGVAAKVEQPFSLTHPDFGTIAVIDTTKEMPTAEDLGKTVFFVTKTQVFIQNRPGERTGDYRVVDLVPRNEQAKATWRDFVVTGTFIETIYRRLRPFAAPLLFIFCVFFFFVWKLIVALLYSLLALILNLFRKEKLSYRSLVNLCFFAITPVIVLQWLRPFLPFLPLNVFVAGFVTGSYLGLAILKTQSTDQGEAARTA